MEIVRCVSCDGFGWYEDDFTGESSDCDWCAGIGYVYRDANGIDHKIPERDWARLADQLEALEQERMREMGYQGEAKKPWEQHIREGTQGGQNPYEKGRDEKTDTSQND
ncbi:hypothetical protein G4Y79_23290 [Phototrophicus methaneseepsis]|uniref:Uncharacterized protein n=1 Tax=Phototrophicus methaneseepsis TaxID=2710758 RepID=A0A7S8E922_9CHLR|nr:hypothetical protein [Phototrophicus methaneseepsis]QPC82577.1 hypothetical protein G4Y79_23290 [Phototrophicus methaneseepsis]